MNKLIFIDGPDCAGKSTLIEHLTKKYSSVIKEFKYTKTNISTYEDFFPLRTEINNLDKNYIYVFDRGYSSNIVYDTVLKPELSIKPSIKFREWLMANHSLHEIFLTRNYVYEDFEDDKISVDKDNFNKIIDQYKLLGPNYNIIDCEHDFKLIIMNIKRLINEAY